MTRNGKRAEDRQALEHLLEVYGADRTRWPARERLRFAGFICENKAAQRLLKEAAALDDLLDRASTVSEDREHALKERIMAAALRSSEAKLAVVPGGAQKRAMKLPTWMRPAAASLGRGTARHELPAAALLAASLFVGVLLGSAGTFNTTVDEVAEVTGFATAGDASQLALGEDIVAFAEEDLL